MSGDQSTNFPADSLGSGDDSSHSAKSVHREKPIIIDVEASGFGYGSYPIEVGFALADGATHCRLIKPLENWTHWCEEAQKLHGVEHHQLIEYGWNPTDIAHWLNEMLNSQTVYSDAWSNDMSWLGKLYNDVGITQNFRLESVLTLLSPEQINSWDATKAATSEALQQQRHRASADAFLIQQTYRNL